MSVLEDPLDVEAAGETEMSELRRELTEFGFKEDDLCREEMTDLLKALRHSKTLAVEEHNRAQNKSDMQFVDDGSDVEPKNYLTRHYKNVAERRLPWCLLPSGLTSAQKISCLSVYKKLVALNQYRRARNQSKFEIWPQPRHIPSDSSSRAVTRATRSGRSAPNYTYIDDDDGDDADDFMPKKNKRRKGSHSEITSPEGAAHTNKIFSLKRKQQKGDAQKPEKEPKSEGNNEVQVLSSSPIELNDQDSGDAVCSMIDSLISCSKKEVEKVRIPLYSLALQPRGRHHTEHQATK